jgi:Domain of unknown function (DUF4352)
MSKGMWAVLAVTAILAAGCSHKEQPASGGESAGAAPSAGPAEQSASAAPSPAENLTATFTFNDVAVTTSGAPVLRLGFTIKNGGQDPVLCGEENFTLQLSDGSVLEPDQGAENGCDPDTIDNGSSGKGTMFFDLKEGYSGPVTLIMTDNGTIIGRGTTQVQ